MSAPYAVIFDMDGVLVDSYAAHYESWKRMAAEQGWQMSPEQFAATFGRTSREIIAHFWGAEGLAPGDILRLDRRKEELFREILEEHFPAMDGAVELIDALRAEGVPLAVGSSGPRENVAMVLQRLDREQAFAVRITGDDVTRGKPDPQVFLLAAERLGMPPSRCVVIEDAPQGIAAAHAGSMACVGVASTGRSRDQLRAADRVVSSLRELTPAGIAALLPSPSPEGEVGSAAATRSRASANAAPGAAGP